MTSKMEFYIDFFFYLIMILNMEPKMDSYLDCCLYSKMELDMGLYFNY